MGILICIILLVCSLFFILSSNSNANLVPPKKVTFNYKCQDCKYEFTSTKKNAFCPECKSDFIDDLANMAGMYMLGDWLGFWGNDEDDIEQSGSDLFEDSWDDDFE